MTWLQMDDHIDEAPVYEKLSDRAHRLHVAASSYSARNETDGVIPKTRADRLIPGNVTDGHLAELTAALWEDVGDSYQLTDYFANGNKSHAWWEERRLRDRQRKESLPIPQGNDAKSAAIPSPPARVVTQPQLTTTPAPSAPAQGSDAQRVWLTWLTCTGKTGRTRYDSARAHCIHAALKDYPVEDVVDAVQGWKNSPHHRGENEIGAVYNDLTLLLRNAEKIEKFRDLWRGGPPPPGQRDMTVEEMHAEFDEVVGAL